MPHAPINTHNPIRNVLFSSVQFSHIWLFATPWTAACQAFLSITKYWSLLRLKSIESVMPFNNPIYCRPLLLLPSIFPSIRVFSNEAALHIRCRKYWTHFSSQNSAIHGLIPGNLFPGTTLWESIFLGTVEYSVQFSHSVVSDSLRPHELQHTRPPRPSPIPGVHPNPCPLS